MPDDLLTTAPRRLVRMLTDLCEMRSRLEVEVQQRFDHADSEAEQELHSGMARFDKRLSRVTSEAEAAYEAAASEATSRFAAADAEARHHFDADRQAILEKASANEKKARSRMDESVWLSETVYEAQQDQPQEEFDRSCKAVDLAKEEIGSITESAAALLRRSRLPADTPPDDAPAARAEAPVDEPAEVLQHELDESMERLREARAALEQLRLPNLFRGAKPIVAGVFVAALAAVAAGSFAGWDRVGVIGFVGGIAAATAGLGLLGLYMIARFQARAACNPLHKSAAEARALCDRCLAAAEAARNRRAAELLRTRDEEVARARRRYEPILDEITRRREAKLAVIDEKYPALLREITERRDSALHAAERERDRALSEARERHERDSSELRSRIESRRSEIRQRFETEWSTLETRWKEGMAEAHALREAIEREDARHFKPWSDPSWDGWQPPHEFAPAVRFGHMPVDIEQLPGGLPKDERLIVPGPSQFTLPATLAFPDRCSMFIETAGDDGGAAISMLQVVMLRLLTCVPPGKVRFTIIDPVGLGQNFAGFMHLADYNDAFVGGKIWTEQRHIEQRLADLTEHMENVIQKYLRNEFETIAQYNEQAGEIAEPYRFLVIADFPVHFSESAAQRLASIITSGARCGVFTLIAADTRHKLPQGIDAADLRRGAAHLVWKDDRLVFDDEDFKRFPLAPDPPPSEEFLTRIMHVVGREALDSSRVEVPFDVIAPQDGQMWSRSTEQEITVALGRTGATRLQHLTLGRGTAQHALVAGKTGSGKSTLLHALITNLTLWYSPHEVELYLIDFKKGVEFKTYATHRVPHVKALAIESDREFGVSVLQRLDQELQRRGALFREAGVQDIAAFRRERPNEPMPRVLLIIDEFQELFTEDDKIAQDASLLLDRLVRQGRAFGMHVLLGSQTLGGAYSLARSTLGQMAVRIALQCSEADSYLILSDDNAAARLLSRPGEAIYNDASGVVEGNSPFQVVWLPEHTRDRYLGRVQETASERGALPTAPPIVFEGNVPADITRNHLLNDLLMRDDWPPSSPMPLAWLGDAIAIKDPTAASFRRLTGSNLLIVGQRDDASLAMLASSMLSLAGQHTPLLPSNERHLAMFYFFDGSAPESNLHGAIESLAQAVPHSVRIVSVRETADAINEIAAELSRRQEADISDAPPICLLMYGLHRLRALRVEDEFSFSADPDAPPSPDKQFATILHDGPPLGIHTLAWCDTVNTVNRTISRSAMRDFEQRVLFQMSPADSSMLIDSPLAARLGFHRALYSSEDEGRLEKFRPYALPPSDWLAMVRKRLAERLSANGVGTQRGSP